VKRLLSLLLCGALVGACGSSSSTTAPTSTAAATSTATITVASFTVTSESSGTGTVYHAVVQFRETGGTTGANITTLTFSSPGSSGLALATLTTTRITAGGTLTTPTINITDSSANTAAATLTFVAAFTDDGGRAGSANGSATVTRLTPVQRFSLVGFVTDKATGRGINGATVRVTSGPDSGTSTTTASTGYYAFGALQSGSFVIQATASGYVAFSQNVTLTGNAQSDVAVATTPPAVEYRITGTARRCGATYENSTGGTSQATVDLPFSYTWSSARSGDFLYMSCQINTGGDNGNITVAIYKNGTLYRSADANGFPNIATASGSY
jgi:hypothetical protein